MEFLLFFQTISMLIAFCAHAVTVVRERRALRHSHPGARLAARHARHTAPAHLSLVAPPNWPRRRPPVATRRAISANDGSKGRLGRD
jgi:hypothetical protein